MKSFTDIEQSKKLAEILPIESADMAYIPSAEDDEGNTLYTAEYKSEIVIDEDDKDIINCWSLAALLEHLDDEIPDKDGNGYNYNLTIMKAIFQYQLYYHDTLGRAEDIETEWYDNLIDACYEMIVKLKEKGLI